MRNRRGQAVVEMALFGSLIFLIFGTLLSQLQRANDQQYAQMECFRRALQKANNGLGQTSEGAGASVKFQLRQNRIHADLSPNFKKGASQALSALSNVFWAVPPLRRGAESANLIAFRFNEDERTFNYRDFVPKEHDHTDENGEERQRFWTFTTSSSDLSGGEEELSRSDSTFSERIIKEEDPMGITNYRASRLASSIVNGVRFWVIENDRDDPNYRVFIRGGIEGGEDLWIPVQGLYRDSDGQYKYSERVTVVDPITRAILTPVIERGRIWRTEF